MAASPVLELLSKDPSATRCSPVPVDGRHSNDVFGGRRKSTSPLLNFADLRQVDAQVLSARGVVAPSPGLIRAPAHQRTLVQGSVGTSHFIAPLAPSLVVCTAPHSLTGLTHHPHAGFLTELAIIATSSHSPLMKIIPDDISTRHALPEVNSVVTGNEEERISPNQASNALVKSINPDLTWSCFLASCWIQNSEGVWVGVDDMRRDITAAQFDVEWDDQLRLISYTTALGNDDVMLATFTVVQDNQHRVTALVPLDHPFIVKGKGWCSFSPLQTEQNYKLEHCQSLELHDVCLPFESDNMFLASSVQGLGLSELDSDAVLALSLMARQRNELNLSRHSSSIVSSSASKKRGSKRNPDRVKRPMNAFMLFAKKYRPEITQDNPGKDNRTISVLLGDKWKEMSWEQREAFVVEARYLAEQHKRLNPDCWKRRKLHDSSKARSPHKS